MDRRLDELPGATLGHDAITVNTLTALQMRLPGKGCRAVSGQVRSQAGRQDLIIARSAHRARIRVTSRGDL